MTPHARASRATKSAEEEVVVDKWVKQAQDFQALSVPRETTIQR